MPANGNTTEDQRGEFPALDFEAKWRADREEFGVVGSGKEMGVIVAITLDPETAGVHGVGTKLPAGGHAKIGQGSGALGRLCDRLEIRLVITGATLSKPLKLCMKFLDPG